MGCFAYLLNADVELSGRDRASLDGVPHVALEGARDVVPLPWICCFRSEDLAPHLLACAVGDPLSLQLPATTIKDAVKNITASLPRYERLIGDMRLARQYWRHAVKAVKTLPYRHLTIDLTDFALCDPQFAVKSPEVFGSRDQPLAASDALFEYHAGVAPLSLASFIKPAPKTARRGAQRALASHNACILFCPSCAPASDPAALFGQMFAQQMTNAEKGIPGCMFQVGQFFLHGRGTTKNVEEGLRWCSKAAEAGDKAAARFLAYLYGNGSLGVPVDPEKAAYWAARAQR